MLCTTYSQKSLCDLFVPYQQWKPFPQAHDRKTWDKLLAHPLNSERMEYLCDAASAVSEKGWPELKASEYMEFERTGNRSHFEKSYMARRRNLSLLVLAECMEHEGRFMDNIINGIWNILGEVTWAVSAHAYRPPLNGGQDPLPPTGHETLALFSIQTAALLAETDYALAQEFEEISPCLRQRIHEQILRRIIAPFEQWDPDSDEPRHRCISGWMNGHNNWTTWCCTNLCTAAMHTVQDMDRLCALAFRLMQGVDRFIAGYGEDGGCDEGPNYWSHAAGALVRFLEILYSRSQGAIDIYSEPKIKEMGLYLPRVHLTGNWFANFADANPKAGVLRAVTYRYGERVNAPEMQALAISFMKNKKGRIAPPIQLTFLMHMIRELFWLPADLPDIGYSHKAEVWMKDIQVMVSRESEEDTEGIILAAKGGHNGESHNHNDLGQFIIFADGTPFIVDAGKESYTRTTFSRDRYTLWPQRSLGHNVPCVNGREQADGSEYRTADVEYRSDASCRSLSMHLENAYPEDAGIISVERTIEHSLSPLHQVMLRDRVEVTETPAELLVPLFTPWMPEEHGPGSLVLTAENGTVLTVTYNSDAAEQTISERVLEDKSMIRQWGPKLYRIEFTARPDSSCAELELVFRKAGLNGTGLA